MGAMAADDNGNDFICGARAMLNTDYIYISGKVAAPSTASGCSNVSSVTYCLDTDDFSSVDVALCTTAGLTNFNVDAILPSQIDADTWGSTANVDYSDIVSKFSTEDLEVDE